ncbi:MAG TPA: hypothetical protein VK106_04235 [Balneolaceae bacterium]|nr:hypothetical protein [Balneolaceae bacterium]
MLTIQAGLLAAHNKKQEKIKDKWYYDPAIITGSSSRDVAEGIRAEIKLKAAPAAGAKTITIKGNMVLDYATGNTKQYTLNNIPLKMDIESEGIQTEIGRVKIYPTAGITVNNTTYAKFNVSGDAPIIGVDVKGNDDTRKLRAATNIGAGTSTGIAFVDPPKAVTLMVTVREIRTEEVPLNLTLSIGG